MEFIFFKKQWVHNDTKKQNKYEKQTHEKSL